MIKEHTPRINQTEYELIYIVPLEKFESIDSIKETIQKIIKHCNGQIKKQSQPQKRKLAFPIKRVKNGIYIVSRVLIEKKFTTMLKEKLKPVPEIIRYSLIRAGQIPEPKKQEQPASTKKPKPVTEKPETTRNKTRETREQPEKKSKKTPKQTVRTKKEQKENQELKKSRKEKLKIEELDKKIDDILKDDLI
ncbi:MAG: 30S ribosomal protein S6 [Patescibacteria group bacterium]|nr:30S ribosomal protein S6 [Patescibacteria group bacterium]